MKRARILMIIVLSVLALCTFFACDKGETEPDCVIPNGYYYYAENDLGSIQQTTWLRFGDDRTWLSSDGYSGSYNGTGSTADLYRGYGLYMSLNYDSVTKSLTYSGELAGGKTVNFYQSVVFDENNYSATLFTPIQTVDDLKAMTATGKYYLANDIDMAGQAWTPIFADENNPFRGVFDGFGHGIYNMTLSEEYTEDESTRITATHPRGFFGILYGATIRNLTISAATINATQAQGATVPKGILAGIAINTNISGCSIDGVIESSVSGSNVFGNCMLGGCVGFAMDCFFFRCKVDADFNYFNRRFNNMYVGGIVGYATNWMKILQCDIGGEIDITHAWYDLGTAAAAGVTSYTSNNCSGGIIGMYNGGTTSGYVNTIYSVYGLSAGLIANATMNSLQISACHANVDIDVIYTSRAQDTKLEKAVAMIGGIVGEVYSDSSDGMTINTSYCNSIVKLTYRTIARPFESYIGGIAARTSATVYNCYFYGSCDADVTIGNDNVMIPVPDTVTVNMYAAGIAVDASVYNSFACGEVKHTVKAPSNVKNNCHLALGAISTNTQQMRNCYAVHFNYTRDLVDRNTNATAKLDGADYVGSECAFITEEQAKTSSFVIDSMQFIPYDNIVKLMTENSYAWIIRDNKFPILYWEEQSGLKH